MFISEFVGIRTTPVSDSFRPFDQQLRRELGLLDGDRRLAYLIFFVPDDAGWPDAPGFRVTDWSNQYLQAGGSADRMGVELRRVDADGDERQYVVGRSHDPDEALSELLLVGDARDERHPAELFGADEAARLFHHYFQHRTVPDEYVLRSLDL